MEKLKQRKIAKEASSDCDDFYEEDSDKIQDSRRNRPHERIDRQNKKWKRVSTINIDDQQGGVISPRSEEKNPARKPQIKNKKKKNFQQSEDESQDSLRNNRRENQYQKQGGNPSRN